MAKMKKGKEGTYTVKEIEYERAYNSVEESSLCSTDSFDEAFDIFLDATGEIVYNYDDGSLTGAKEPVALVRHCKKAPKQATLTISKNGLSRSLDEDGFYAMNREFIHNNGFKFKRSVIIEKKQ